MRRQRFIQSLLIFLGCLGLCIGLVAACQQEQPLSEATLPPTPVITQLAAVESLSPPQIPDWITAISPLGSTQPEAQIRIQFRDPVIPLSQLDAPAAASLLEFFELTPALPGQFRILTPQMITFQADQALPIATRAQVRLKAGLSDTLGNTLTEDLVWSFETPDLTLQLQEGELSDLPTRPEIPLQTNAALDLETTQVRVVNSDSGTNKSVRLVAVADDPLRYIIKPDLAANQRYSLEISPVPAVGNVAGRTLQRNLSTYQPLVLRALERYGEPDGWSAQGRFSNGAPLLRFNNSVTAHSLSQALRLDPPPKADVPLFRLYDTAASQVEINPWALEPQTNYSLTLGTELRDIFDQQLSQAETVRFSTADLAPDLWLPEGLHIFPQGLDVSLNINSLNLPAGYRFARRPLEPRDLVFREGAYPNNQPGDLLPEPESWPLTPLESERNEALKTEVPLPGTGVTAYGVKAQLYQYTNFNNERQWAEREFYGLVLQTNLGLFAQWFPTGGLVRVHHLDDGQPAANVRVELYRSALYRDPEPGDGEVCAAGETDANGVVRFERSQLQRCQPDVNQPPEILAVAREVDDWSFVRTQSYSGAYSYGIFADWQTEPALGALFSDRQLYQPGETAHWTGLAYGLADGELVADADVPYTITVRDAQGEEQNLGERRTDAYGVLSFEMPVSSLGQYFLEARHDERRLYGDLEVADFRPPNFQVELELPTTAAVAGDRLTAQAQSRYLFGAPVSDAPINYFLTRRPTEFQPEAWPEFRFGPQWDWPEERPDLSFEVLQTRDRLDAEGAAELQFELDESLPYALDYRLDAQVQDVSNQSITASRSFVVLPSAQQVGLKHNYVGQAAEPLAVEVVVTDAAGVAIANQAVTVELEAVTYNRVNEVRAGSVIDETQVSYESVATAQVRSGLQPQSINLTPPSAGSYRLVAYRTNDRDHVSHSRVWVAGADVANWSNRWRNDYLELHLDQERYQVGDTVTVLVPSPYAQAELALSVIRDRVLLEQTQTVLGSGPQVQFTVTPEMLPNAAIQVVLTRQGQPLQVGAENERLEMLQQIGLVDLLVDPSEQRLAVTLTPNEASLAPGAEQSLTISLRDSQDQPVAGQVTLMVVNDAILQLNGYRPPDPLDAVFANRPVPTRFSSNLRDVVLAPFAAESLEKGWGYGGGLGAAAANTRTRRDFQPLAYYDARVAVDASGEATVTFPLPDDLTTWRVMAIATTQAQQFGQAEATFQTSLPLLANPLLPRFARVGDLFAVGASITNTAQLSGDLSLTASLDPGLVQFSDAEGNLSSDINERRPVPSTTEAVRQFAIASQVGQSTFSLSIDQGDHQDAFSLPLDVLPLVNPEQVISAGLAPMILPLQFGGDVIQESLEIQLADQIVPTLGERLARLSRRDRLPLLEPAASRLLIAAEIQRLQERHPDLAPIFNVAAEASRAIADLQALQAANGGFRPWADSGDYTQPFVSAYAARAIAAAETAGIVVPPVLRDRLQGYLQSVTNNPSDCPGCIREQRLEALLGLAELGQRRPDLMASLYADREQLSELGRIKLARLLGGDPNWQTEAAQLTTTLIEVTYSTGRAASLNLPTSWQWYGSATAAQAELLQLLVQQDTNAELLHQVAQGLMDLQREGAWPSLYDNAVALSALANYQPNRDVSEATVSLGSETLGTFSFPGRYHLSRTDLPRGASELRIDSDGELPYLAAYSYSLPGPQPGRLQGMRVTRTIQPANSRDTIATLGLRQPSEPISLPVGAIFDVGLEIILDHAVDHVEITDFLPAGLEAVNSRFQTSNPFYAAQTDSWQLRAQTQDRDQISAYADRLEAGVYRLHYLVQSVTPGTFSWPGGIAQARYNPADFGRTASSIVRIGSN